MKKILYSKLKGAISVEMSFVMGFFALFLVLAYDVGGALVIKTKLDRISYSLASIVREREMLYPNELKLTKQNTQDLLKLAQSLSKDSLQGKLGLNVEMASFKGKRMGDRGGIEILRFSAGALECRPEKKIEDFKDASFFTTNGNYIPLYRVTLCAAPTQLFKPIAEIGLFKPISSALVFGR